MERANATPKLRQPRSAEQTSLQSEAAHESLVASIPRTSPFGQIGRKTAIRMEVK